MAEPPLMDVQSVTIRFRRRGGVGALFRRAPSVRAVEQVDLAIGAGEVVGLVGESGSGKTTLGRAVLRLFRPDAGAIVFEGQDITALDEAQLRRVRRRMGMVFQDPLSSFNPRHTIGAALAAPLRVAGVAGAQTRIDVAAALGRVRLSAEAAERYPHELSGGQLQRAALARALMLSPTFVVADEAVSKLDVSVRSQVLNLFRDVQDALGIAFLFITHDLHVARFVCDRVAVMFFGRIVESAPAAELFRAPRHPYTRALLATLDDPGEGAPLAGRGAVDPDAPGCIYRTQCRRRLPRCAEAHPPTLRIGPDHVLACYNPA